MPHHSHDSLSAGQAAFAYFVSVSSGAGQPAGLHFRCRDEAGYQTPGICGNRKELLFVKNACEEDHRP
jgi:hypothetical protein